MVDAMGPVHTEIWPQPYTFLTWHHVSWPSGQLLEASSTLSHRCDCILQIYLLNYKQQKYVCIQTKCISDFTSPHLHTSNSCSPTNTVIWEGTEVGASYWNETAVLRRRGQNTFLCKCYKTIWPYRHTGPWQGPNQMRALMFNFN